RRSRAARSDHDRNRGTGGHGDGVGVAERTTATAAGAKLTIEPTTAPAGADNHDGHLKDTWRYDPFVGPWRGEADAGRADRGGRGRGRRRGRRGGRPGRRGGRRRGGRGRGPHCRHAGSRGRTESVRVEGSTNTGAGDVCPSVRRTGCAYLNSLYSYLAAPP